VRITVQVWVCCVVVSLVSRASAQQAPPWFNLLDRASGSCYCQGMGEGRSPREAEANAWGSILTSLAAERIDTVHTEIFDLQQRLDGQRADEARIESSGQALLSGNGGRLFRTVAQEQIQDRRGVFRYYILICKNSECECAIEYPSDVGARIRSAILPGWGQNYKGRTGRGIAFLSVSMLALAAGTVSFGLAGRFRNEAIDARTGVAQNQYSQWRDAALSVAVISVTLDIGMYAWNIFDAGCVRGIPKLR
jgi:hypothetical protein